MTALERAALPPCYGVMCPMHSDCERYRAVESMPAARVVVATCVTPAGRRPGFVLVAEVCA